MSNLRILLAALLVALPSFAHAAVVTSPTLNCRVAPRPSAKVVTVLHRATSVPELSRRGGWAYLDPPSTAACWALARFLRSDAIGAAQFSAARARNETKPHSRNRFARADKPRATPTHFRRRASNFGGGGSCPCGSRSVCIGPRGGRYCITSGGNKRYGV